jgi:putative peptide zinc metalloprotease protein
VTAAGGWIQLVMASVAAIVWWVAAPGTLVANVAVATMLVGGASTLLTNANPLLPLDGYFAFTDWMEIPNLRLRAFAHFRWWVRRTLLRLEEPEPAATPRERRVFLIYGALGTAYITSLFVFLVFLLVGWARGAFGVIGGVSVALLLAMLLRKRIAGWMRALVLTVRARRDALRRMRRPARIALVVAVLVLLLVPWTLTSSGAFVVGAVDARAVTAADSGVVAQLFVGEGMRVEAGTPLLRVVDADLERSALAAGRTVDSLAVAESAARSAGHAADAARLAAQRAAAEATLAGIDRRIADLTLRATATGIVMTPHAEELIGRRVSAGDTLLTLAASDSVELRIALAGAGATRVRAGQVVHVISYADPYTPWTSYVADVATSGIARGQGDGAVEVRVRRPAGDAWRPGAVGEASVELARSNVLGALWWNARQMLRVDLLL